MFGAFYYVKIKNIIEKRKGYFLYIFLINIYNNFGGFAEPGHENRFVKEYNNIIYFFKYS